VLTQQDFEVVLADFPEFDLIMRRESIKRVVTSIPFFKNLPQEVLDYFVENLKPQSYSDGKLIIQAGDVGQEMYFLAKGSCEAVSADGRQVYATMKEGSFFGEIALLFDMKRTASVRAIGHIDVFMLSQASLSSRPFVLASARC
jgi:CRP-like cAMP-binding protein